MALFDGLKNLLKADAEEESVRDLGLAEIGGWLREREEAVNHRLEEETQGPRANIRAAIHDLKEAVQGLAQAQHHDVPPRVEAILRTAVPAYISAMEKALAREIPDRDPEAFYAAASSTLTDVIRATRTRGKYLSVAHPETARAIRSATQQFGDAINTMTATLHTAREQVAAIRECREAAGALGSIRDEYEHTRERMAENEQRLHLLNDSLHAVELEKERLAASAEVREALAKEEELLRAKKRLEEVLDEHRRTAKTAAGLIRRTAKDAEERNDTAAATSCRRALAILEGEGDIRDLRDALPPAEESVQAALAGGRLRIKNKEEQALARDAGDLLVLLERLASRIGAERVAVESAEEAVEASPGRRLQKEVADRESRLTREKDRVLHTLVSEERHLEHLESDYAGTLARLRERAQVVARGEVTIRAPDLISYHENTT